MDDLRSSAEQSLKMSQSLIISYLLDTSIFGQVLLMIIRTELLSESYLVCSDLNEKYV